MIDYKNYDVIIVGGSFAGLSAGLALARSLRKILILDNGTPCNKPTPHSHNFLTHDGQVPAAISEQALLQLLKYKTLTFLSQKAETVLKNEDGFMLETASGGQFFAKKLLFATGLSDQMPDLAGFSECWGISILHCPYCDAYEVSGKPIGVIANGDAGFDLVKLVRNWTPQLTLFTNGISTLTPEQAEKLGQHGIGLIEKEIQSIGHDNGRVKHLLFKDGSTFVLSAIFSKVSATQQCDLPQTLGCEMTETGLIKIDDAQQTNIAGAYAAGDNSTPYRAVSVAIASGTKAGAFMNKAFIDEYF